MTRIESLTREQEVRLVEFREQWRAVGIRTGHDAECESVGEKAVRDAYEECGFAPPALTLWAQSPLQALLMHWALTRLLDQQALAVESGVDLSINGALQGPLAGQLQGPLAGQLRGQLWGQLWGQLRDQLRGQLRGQLQGQLADQLAGQLQGQLAGQLRGQLRGQLQGQLADQLRDQLRGQLQDQLWGQLRNQLQDQLQDQLWGQLQGQLWGAYNQTWCWGQCDSYWSCYYRFAIDIGVKVTPDQDRRLAILERLARAAFMVLSWRGVSIIVQHPTAAHFDARRRLHSVDGPALAWPDGYAVYAIAGIGLTPERGAAMADRTLSASQIRDEPNAEVRRVLVATYNAGDSGRYVRDVGASVIHADVDALGLSRRLLRIDQPDDEPFIAIEVTNSTPEPDGTRKLYTFRCDPECRPLAVGVRIGWPRERREPQEMTCLNAIASTYGHTGPEYQLAVET